jgi:hypothetical protein
VSPIPRILDDVLLKSPIRQIFVFALFFGLNNVTGEVAADMFHALIPTTFAFEDPSTEATSAASRWFSFLHPAALTNTFKTILKSTPILIASLTGSDGSRAGASLGLVHASMMLSEEILAVEVVVDTLMTGDGGVQVGIAGANVATIEAELKVLNGNMALPFVLGAESDIAAVVRERADELAFGWL